MLRRLGLAVLVTTSVTAWATAAPAAAAAGPTFGEHVAACAHAQMFSGDHNPGTHQGAAGWDGSTCPP